MLGPGCKANDTHVTSQQKPGPSVPVACPIPVLIGNRKRMVNLLRERKHPTGSVNLSNLTSIPRQLQLVSKNWAGNTFSKLYSALLNIRSLSGKTFLINDFIIKRNLDFMFLTETWLDKDNSAAVLIA